MKKQSDKLKEVYEKWKITTEMSGNGILFTRSVRRDGVIEIINAQRGIGRMNTLFMN